jgi:hypothetical protein
VARYPAQQLPIAAPFASKLASLERPRSEESYTPRQIVIKGPVKAETVEIPAAVLASIETVDELQDWLTAQNPVVIAELRPARRDDLAGKFKPWKPRHRPCPTKSK